MSVSNWTLLKITRDLKNKYQIDILELKNVMTEDKNRVGLKADYIAEERVSELWDGLEDGDPE